MSHQWTRSCLVSTLPTLTTWDRSTRPSCPHNNSRRLWPRSNRSISRSRSNDADFACLAGVSFSPSCSDSLDDFLVFHFPPLRCSPPLLRVTAGSFPPLPFFSLRRRRRRRILARFVLRSVLFFSSFSSDLFFLLSFGFAFSLLCLSPSNFHPLSAAVLSLPVVLTLAFRIDTSLDEPHSNKILTRTIAIANKFKLKLNRNNCNDNCKRAGLTLEIELAAFTR